MYNAGNYISDHHSNYHSRISEIRKRESIYRDSKARKMIKQLNNERTEKGLASPNPVLVSREMVCLPPAASYLRTARCH